MLFEVENVYKTLDTENITAPYIYVTLVVFIGVTKAEALNKLVGIAVRICINGKVVNYFHCAEVVFFEAVNNIPLKCICRILQACFHLTFDFLLFFSGKKSA